MGKSHPIWPKEREYPGDIGQELPKEEVVGWNCCLRRCKKAFEAWQTSVSFETMNREELLNIVRSVPMWGQFATTKREKYWDDVADAILDYTQEVENWLREETKQDIRFMLENYWSWDNNSACEEKTKEFCKKYDIELPI